MSERARYARVVLPLVTGVAGAVLGIASVAGAALLLHPGAGALATAGLLLSLDLASVAAAFWVGASGARGGPTRGRWMAAVLAFAAAALFGDFYMELQQVRQLPLGGALAALLFLAAPAYTIGSVLAALARRGRTLIVPTLAGAALGAVAAAVVLIPKLDPGVLYFTCATALLLAGMAELRWAPAGAREEEGDMNGKVVIVSGAGARGQVGVALVEAFLDRGARVALADVRPEVEAIARELGERGEALGVVADLTAPDDADRVVQAVRERFGRLDVVVNAAGGLTVVKPLAETTVEEWDREIERNARTAFLLSRAALPLLRDARGTIVNFASPAGIQAAAKLGAYSAAKAGVIAVTRALALEEARHGVRVNAVAPGMIDTEQNRAAVEDPAAVEWVTREQVANVVLFLAGGGSAAINGEVVRALGGGLE